MCNAISLIRLVGFGLFKQLILREWKRKQRMTEELKVELALKMLLVLRIRSLIYLYQMKLKNRLIAGLRNWKGSRKDGWIGKYKRKESRR